MNKWYCEECGWQGNEPIQSYDNSPICPNGCKYESSGNSIKVVPNPHYLFMDLIKEGQCPDELGIDRKYIALYCSHHYDGGMGCKECKKHTIEAILKDLNN